MNIRIPMDSESTDKWSDEQGPLPLKVEKKSVIWSDRFENNTAAVFKMYRHRGPVTCLRERISQFRVEREYRVLKCMDSNGIPCAQPLFWSHGYSANLGFYEILVTREIRGVTSLKQFLTSDSGVVENIDLKPLFQIVREMHECGIYHGALRLKNILIFRSNSGQLSFFIIDTPRAKLFPHSIFNKRIAWFDLLKLSVELERWFGTGYCRPLLLEYGVDQESIRKFYNQLDHIRSKNYSRRRFRIEFETRAFLVALAEKIMSCQRVH